MIKNDTEAKELSKEVILKIKEAEAQAERIRNDAQEEAKARVRRAEEDG